MNNGLAIAIALLAACGPMAQDQTPAADTTSVDTPPPQPGVAAPDSNVVSFGGTHGFVPGMSLMDARARIPGLQAPAGSVEGCDYASLGEGDDGLTFLIVDNQLERVDVVSAAYPTDRGIAVGSSEAQVKAAYPNVVVQPHKYTDGRYLIAANPEDTTVALIFETDGTNVTRYRVGKQPVVGWVEGCS